MATPKAPPTITMPPDIRDDEDPTTVLSENGSGHLHTLQDGCAVSVYVDDLLFDLEGVHDVVAQDLQPAWTRHDGSSRMSKDKGVLIVQNVFSSIAVSFFYAPLKEPHALLEFDDQRRSPFKPV
jgi:hypothetical protein